MKVDVLRLLEREPCEQQRMLAALRFADLAAFREVLAYVCGQLAPRRYHPHNLQGSRRRLWVVFVQKEFARDAAEVPEAAVALFLIRAFELHAEHMHRRRVEAAVKGRRTLEARGGKPFRKGEVNGGRRRIR